MKLRNKKTGKVIDANELLTDRFILDLYSRDFDYFISKLHKIAEEWEDYEEPKDIWWLDNEGNVNHATSEINDNFEKNREIGNYFKTKEEAEKAVKKLKAWKRLKDKGFSFTDDLIYGEFYGCGSIGFIIFPSKKEKVVIDDLKLLFGGEE